MTSTTLMDSNCNSITASLKDFNYQLYHITRKGCRKVRGGGVGFLSKIILNIKQEVVKQFQAFEYDVVKLKCRRNTLKLVTLYRLDYETSPIFFEEFTELLETLIASGDKFIIAGDFNIHFEIATDSMTARLMEIFSIFNLSQLVLGATHRHGHTLDLVITHLPDIDISNIDITNIHLGDHYLINFEVTLCIEITEYKTVHNRNIRQINKRQFSDELAIVLNGINLDEKLEHLINTHAPVTKRNIKVVNHASWLDNEYREMRKRRRKAEKNVQKDRSDWGQGTVPGITC